MGLPRPRTLERSSLIGDQVGTFQGRGTHTGIRGPFVLPNAPATSRAGTDEEHTTVQLQSHTPSATDLIPPPDLQENPLLPLTELDDEIDRLGTAVPCRTYDPEVFFAESPADVEYAKTLCQTCPVREACLAGAKDRREPWGVWGGELFVQGVVVPRKRPRGRPRKNPVVA
ncbi:hypothetical protein GCM10010341_01810 [Streptomyces noursei]|nr:hypothetical protein GCM10010341_01810 [Streptomyces noursei]